MFVCCNSFRWKVTPRKHWENKQHERGPWPRIKPKGKKGKQIQATVPPSLFVACVKPGNWTKKIPCKRTFLNLIRQKCKEFVSGKSWIYWNCTMFLKIKFTFSLNEQNQNRTVPLNSTECSLVSSIFKLNWLQTSYLLDGNLVQWLIYQMY